MFVENDAAAAAMGEMQFGRGHQYHSFFYMLITAGLGGGLVMEGHYLRGASGRSGELSWLPVGAAILPFTHRLLPTRTALMKVSAS